MKQIDFYSKKWETHLKKSIRILMLAIVLIAAAGAAVCLWLLFSAKTRTAQRNELLVYLINAVVGGIVIALIGLFLLPKKRLLAHCKAIGETEKIAVPFSAGLIVSEKREKIPGGVVIRRVTLRGEDGKRLFIYDGFAQLLENVGTSGILYERSGYVTGFTTGGQDE